MQNVKNSEAFKRLPQRLTISFPIWGLIDIGTNGVYNDTDKFMREHAERGFNCVRFDSGAGLAHDLSGRRRGAVNVAPVFGEYSGILRQFDCAGGVGKCDVVERLVKMCESAKKYGVYIVLSSWYYLHTFWQTDNELNRELFAIPPHERFMAFAKFLDYILVELENRKLDGVIAFAEIFNEADGLRFIDGYGHENHLSKEELHRFRGEHDEALRFLQTRHPQILFAYDCWGYHPDPDQTPASLQVYNFHNYYFGDLYDVFEYDENVRNTMLDNKVSREQIRASREGLMPVTEDWVERAWFYNNLKDECIPQAEAWLEKYLCENEAEFKDRIRRSVVAVKEFTDGNFPNIPIVCGEGASYCGSKKLLFDDTSPRVWELIEYAARSYRDAGLWGTVVRTCCGPEDPGWTLAAEHIRRVNDIFTGKIL